MPKSVVSRGQLPEIPEKLLEVINARAKKLYFLNKNKFIADAMDEEDIKQELLLEAYKTLTKFKRKKEDEIWKIVNHNISWVAKKLVRNSIEPLKRFYPRDIESLYDEPIVHQNLTVQPEDASLSLILHKKCSEQEFKLLQLRVIEGKTFDEIAEQMNLSKQRIEQIYKLLVKKMRKKLLKWREENI